MTAGFTKDGFSPGNIELIGKIGEGGLAEVYFGIRRGISGFSTKVAVKRIRPEFVRDNRYTQMFVDEAKLAGELSHSNIVRTFELEQASSGDIYAVLEYVDGVDLGSLLDGLRQHGQVLPLDESLYLIRQVLSGLSCLHELVDESGCPRGIVHADITPRNILISGTGEVKLADLGLAIDRQREGEAFSRSIKGQVNYMSPEQFERTPLDARADLFAAAIVLWECLAGTQLFPGETHDEIIHAICYMPRVPPSKRNRSVPDALDEMVLQALEPQRDRRQQSARELLRMLSGLRIAPDEDAVRKNLGYRAKECKMSHQVSEGQSGCVSEPGSPWDTTRYVFVRNDADASSVATDDLSQLPIPVALPMPGRPGLGDTRDILKKAVPVRGTEATPRIFLQGPGLDSAAGYSALGFSEQLRQIPQSQVIRCSVSVDRRRWWGLQDVRHLIARGWTETVMAPSLEHRSTGRLLPVLGDLAVARWSGTIWLSAADGGGNDWVGLSLRSGGLVASATSIQEEDLFVWLLETGILSEDELTAALSEVIRARTALELASAKVRSKTVANFRGEVAVKRLLPLMQRVVCRYFLAPAPNDLRPEGEVMPLLPLLRDALISTQDGVGLRGRLSGLLPLRWSSREKFDAVLRECRATPEMVARLNELTSLSIVEPPADMAEVVLATAVLLREIEALAPIRSDQGAAELLG
jgi:serine/threonine protein kinase